MNHIGFSCVIIQRQNATMLYCSLTTTSISLRLKKYQSEDEYHQYQTSDHYLSVEDQYLITVVSALASSALVLVFQNAFVVTTPEHSYILQADSRRKKAS